MKSNYKKLGDFIQQVKKRNNDNILTVDNLRGINISKEFMPSVANVTGTGCMTTALVGAFCGAGTDYFIGAISGITAMGISGEISLEKAGKIGTGSFHIAIIDAISNLNSEIIENMAQVQEV